MFSIIPFIEVLEEAKLIYGWKKKSEKVYGGKTVVTFWAFLYLNRVMDYTAVCYLKTRKHQSFCSSSAWWLGVHAFAWHVPPSNFVRASAHYPSDLKKKNQKDNKAQNGVAYAKRHITKLRLDFTVLGLPEMQSLDGH